MFKLALLFTLAALVAADGYGHGGYHESYQVAHVPVHHTSYATGHKTVLAGSKLVGHNTHTNTHVTHKQIVTPIVIKKPDTYQVNSGYSHPATSHLSVGPIYVPHGHGYDAGHY